MNEEFYYLGVKIVSNIPPEILKDLLDKYCTNGTGEFEKFHAWWEKQLKKND